MNCSYCQKAEELRDPDQKDPTTTTAACLRLWQCSNCRGALYCSVRCQKLDWRLGGHRQICRPERKNTKRTNTSGAIIPAKESATAAAAANAQVAWNELSQILGQASRKDLQHDFALASDQLDKELHAQILDDKRRKAKDAAATTKSSSETIRRQKPQQRKSDETSTAGSRPTSIQYDESNSLPSSNRKSPASSAAATVGEAVSTANSMPIHRLGSSNSMDCGDSGNKMLQWDYFMEDRRHLSCYQVLLRPSLDTSTISAISLESLQLSLVKETNNVAPIRTTLVSLVHNVDNDGRVPSTVFCTELFRWNGHLDDTDAELQLLDSGGPGVTPKSISIRLRYWKDEGMYDSEPWIAPPTPLLSPHIATRHLACSTCQNLMLDKKDESEIGLDRNELDAAQQQQPCIQRVLPLPSGHWDEMQDYLVCYEGQSSFDFSSSSTCGQRGTLLEDATTLVAHKLDVGNAACVVALPGYGVASHNKAGPENTAIQKSLQVVPTSLANIDDDTTMVRGGRIWCEAVVGAALTCSLCASYLGFATIAMPDTYRLLKHRVSIVDDVICTAPDSLQTISVFVAHEMIRYAETKAIFTFFVQVDDDSSHRVETNGHNVIDPHQSRSIGSAPRRSRGLQLRLVSWDTIAASGTTPPFAKTNQTADTSYIVPSWKKRCKILFEEMEEDIESSESYSTSDGNALWLWTRPDRCCLRTGQDTDTETKEQAFPFPPASSPSRVCLCLSGSEWEQLKFELMRESQWYTTEVSNATFLATLGRLPVAVESSGASGLTSIAL